MEQVVLTHWTTWPGWKAAVLGPKGVSISIPKVMTCSYRSFKHHGSQSPPKEPTAWERKAHHFQLLHTLPFGHGWVRSERGQRGTELWCPAGQTQLSGRSREIKSRHQVWTAVVLWASVATWQKHKWGLPSSTLSGTYDNEASGNGGGVVFKKMDYKWETQLGAHLLMPPFSKTSRVPGGDVSKAVSF